MLLKSIKLKDFRQFKGLQKPIRFSTDTHKNVTVIMGENGSGKTSLAQAFTWCLYGDTTFDDKSMLCKATANNLGPSENCTVKVELELEHNKTEYTIIREQVYSKDSSGKLKRPNNTVLKIAYKNKDGQRDFVKELETEIRIKEILPKELSKYFFFDGERITNMSKDISKGRSDEFAQAVKSLLGLSAFLSALNHLNGRARTSVIRSYDESYDSSSDAKIAQYTKEINEYEDRITKSEDRIKEIEAQVQLADEKCEDLRIKIADNIDSEDLAKEKERLVRKAEALVITKEANTTALIKLFNKNGPAYFSRKLMRDALQDLSNADKLDKGIPNIHAKTIEYLINERGRCICGAKIEFGNSAHKELMDLLEYIPPQSIGLQVGQFVRECELKNKSADTFYQEISEKYSVIRGFETNYAETLNDISIIEKNLSNMKSVGEWQTSLMRYEKGMRELNSERDQLNKIIGGLDTKKERRITERHELTLKDENNRKIEVYKAYAKYMYEKLLHDYEIEETKIREQLETIINKIFRNIYNGGLSLNIDEKYNIQVIVNENTGYNDYVETSTAQSISVIFAFITGVIQMARKSQNPENEMLVSEPYPLVMDAPLSAFDKTRIKTVCDSLPKVAEQVIIFIKDTDGEIAEENMGDKVGMRYKFDKKSELEVYVEER